MKGALVSQNTSAAATEAGAAKRPLLLFAPGAGAPSTSPWMENWRERLSTVGRVVTFDYPYQRKGSRRPDPLPVLIQAHQEALQNAVREQPGELWLVGKSMGSRVGCHVAKTNECAGVICFGYPLVSQSGTERSTALIECPAPLLLIQGTRDRLAPLEALRTVIAKRNAPTHLVVVQSGDHSLDLTRTHLRSIGKTQAETDSEILAELRAFTGADRRVLSAETEVGAHADSIALELK